MNFEIITTERLQLRKITPDVLHYVFENYSDEKLMEFMGINSPVELIKEKEKHKKGMSTFNKSFLYFYLIDKSTGKITGWCGFHTWYLDHSRAEIGYGLNEESSKRKGFMTEAIQPIIKYGFETMKLNRIEAFIGPKNEASLHLIKKMGFIKEGHLRQHYYKNNMPEDSIVFSLLREEAEPV